MTQLTKKQQILDSINNQFNWNYELNTQGRVFKMFMGKKMWTTIDKLQASVEELIISQNINENNSNIKDYLKENNFTKQYVCKAGNSVYFTNGQITIRISDHSNQSEHHEPASINAFSDEKNGYIEILNKISTFKN